MLVKLKGLFSPQCIAEYMKSLLPIKTTIMDELFPDRPTHPFATVGVKDIVEVVGTVPVVARDGRSVDVSSGNLSIAFIEPLPLKPARKISGTDLNNLKLLVGDNTSLKNYAKGETDHLRKTVRKSTEGICCTALTGKISWPVKLEAGGYETYEINYGDPLSVVPKKKIDADDAAIADLEAILSDMEDEIQEAGVGSDIKYLAGKKVWNTISRLIDNFKSTAELTVKRVGKGEVDINGYIIRKCSETYRNPQTNAVVSKIPPHKILAYATDAPGKVMYCALDNIESGLRPLPFQPVVYELDEGRGFKIVGYAKPLPVRSPKSICWAEVTAPAA